MINLNLYFYFIFIMYKMKIDQIYKIFINKYIKKNNNFYIFIFPI